MKQIIRERFRSVEKRWRCLSLNFDLSLKSNLVLLAYPYPLPYPCYVTAYRFVFRTNSAHESNAIKCKQQKKVYRKIRTLESAGVSALHLVETVWPGTRYFARPIHVSSRILFKGNIVVRSIKFILKLASSLWVIAVSLQRSVVQNADKLINK